MRIALLGLLLLATSSTAYGQVIRDRNAAGGIDQNGFGQAGFGQDGFGQSGFGQGADARWQNPGGGTWRPPTYQLGVTVRNTDRGVVLTSVLAGSSAQRAGLERNDTILTVGGYQVGYVGRQLYDLADEINARIGPDGRILMLIQNARNGELRNLTIDMASSRSVVNGTARWGTDVSLSREAMLVVRIVDVTNPAWRDTIVAEQIIRGVTRGNATYEIGFAPGSLQQNHRYAVSAHVRDGNAVLFELTSPKSINTSGGSQRIDFTLDRVRGSGGIQPGGFPTAQIVDLYRNLLGRAPTAREITLWQAEFARGATLDDVRRQLLGGSEYYDKNRNDDDRFLRDVYGQTQGRAPDAAEIERMKQKLQSSGGLRTDLVRELMRRIDASGQPPR